VVLLGVIAKDGTMKSLQIISSTNTNLNQSAIDAVQQWTYKPTLLNNEPVESMIDVTVNYSLRK